MSKSKLYRSIAATLIAVLLTEVLMPAAAMALTSGPTQPEFSGFEPVATTSMVSEFAGAFTYNLPVISIPGPNGMGYALSLSYHNATSVEEEASWVGLGWTLNPGSIGRVKRGFPDEYKGAEVEYWNRVKDNWTVSVTKRLGIEAFSKDATASAFTTQRFNNYTGYGYVSGFSLGLMGVSSISFTEADGKSSWGFQLSPVRLLIRLIKGKDDHSKAKEKAMPWADRFERAVNKQLEDGAASMTDISSSGGIFGIYTFNDYTLPVNTTSYKAETWMGAVAAQGDIMPNTGLEGGISGSSTVQKSIPRYTRKAYGYMYSGVADNFDRDDEDEEDDYNAAAMDFYMEKDAPYNKRDRFLGIPFTNADNFIVTGEGLSGSFRLHQRHLGQFHPPVSESSTDIFHVNLDLHFGGGFGFGADLGYGDHSLSIDEWEKTLEEEDGTPFSFSDASGDDEPYFFRFADDMGGYLTYAGNDNAVQASETGGLLSDQLSMENKIWLQANEGKVSGRAGYIGFNTNNRIKYHPPLHCWDGGVNNSVDLRGYAKEKTGGTDAYRISQFIDRGKVGDDVGEFAVTKEDGSIYVYGLPVYSRDEAELQFGVQGVPSTDIDQNLLVYKHGEAKEDAGYAVVGEVRKTPYPSAYLLTEILSSDYVDRTNDGPTPDDLGGYVWFNYERKAGAPDKKGSSVEDWYRWRMPYKGLHYQKNSFSDPYDDVGSVQSGYKEIYYLSSVETRTHKALFDLSPRKDGYPAEQDEKMSATNKTSSAADDTESPKLYKLDRIRLYAKDAGGGTTDLLRTVNFEYTYALCQALPNSEMGSGKRLGKLTLKRVWFEHEGVFGVRTSPYEFGYEYRPGSTYPSSIQSRYGAIVNFSNNWNDADWQDDVNEEQNSDYRSPSTPGPHDARYLDRWGNYQYDGKTRHDRHIPWVDQTPDMSEFDPAAWQLKWIKLPSGGEIHVQYEQHDYRYVQHRPAMGMMSLTDKRAAGGYYLNPADFGLTYPADDPEIDRLVDEIRKLYIDNGEYIYFKFLYALEGTNADLDRCSSEYITGYASVTEVGQETDGRVWIKVGGGTPYSLPEEVCLDFVRTSRAGVIQTGTSCDPSVAGIPQPEGEDGTLEAMWELFTQFGDAYVDEGNTCQVINYANSYFRVPMTRAKLGGGIRVKRLLMYDAGLEEVSGEDVALYGTEYFYRTIDGQSSGVATNEPAIGREENPLVGLINKRRDKTTAESIFSADTREQFEGPLGESIMPGASIGYSRVVARNIYRGKTGAGYMVSEFFTARDYPFDLQYSTSSNQSVKDLKNDMTDIDGPALKKLSIGVPVASYSVSSIWRTQGFRFVLNAMNGKPKSVTKCVGDYDDVTPSYREPAFVERIAYEYYEPGEALPVMTGPSANDITPTPLGKEMEVVMASRIVEDIANDYGIEGDYEVFLGFLFPLPFGSVQGSYRRSETIMKTHVTTKVVHYPAVQKRVTVTKDGIADVTEYIGFDAKSGKAVLTRNYDGYRDVAIGSGMATDKKSGAYYSVTLPAWRYYPAMGQIAERQSRTFGGPSDAFSVDKRYDGTQHYLLINLKAGAVGKSTPLEMLFPGDLVEIKSKVTETKYERLGVYHVGTVAGNRIQLLPASYSLINDYQLRPDVYIEILRAANTNQLTTNAGSFTTYSIAPSVVKHPPQ